MLLKLGRLKEAGEVYRELIERNAENWYYYEGLEKSLQPSKLKCTGTLKIPAIQHILRTFCVVYCKLSSKSFTQQKIIYYLISNLIQLFFIEHLKNG